MSEFVLSCCSTADLSAKHFAERDIHYIQFHYSLDGKQYRDDLGRTMSYKAFYAAMAEGQRLSSRTAQKKAEKKRRNLISISPDLWYSKREGGGCAPRFPKNRPILTV